MLEMVVSRATGNFIGTMHYGQSTIGPQGKPVVIDGLWALKVGNDQNGKSGHANVLYFTAGPNGEADGLFGALAPDGLYGTHSGSRDAAGAIAAICLPIEWQRLYPGRARMARIRDRYGQMAKGRTAALGDEPIRGVVDRVDDLKAFC
jgi:hypothetical protein